MTTSPWTVSRDLETVKTSKAVEIGGNVTVGTARTKRDLIVAGTIKADAIAGSIHYSQITGLLGDGFSVRLPDVADNLATVDVAGETVGQMVIITGPGYDIERVSGFDARGLPDDQPGFAMAHPFIFEASGTNADDLRTYFDQYLADPAHGGRSMSLIIRDLAQRDVFRWNLFEFVPESYDPGADGRTRFRFAPSLNPTIPHAAARFWADPKEDPFSNGISYDPATTKRVEIPGVTDFCPQVVLNEADRALSLTFGLSEGRGIFTWVKDTVEGIATKRDLSVMVMRNGAKVTERNYYGIFPMKYEQFTGFGLPTKLKARVVLSYDSYEDV